MPKRVRVGTVVLLAGMWSAAAIGGERNAGRNPAVPRDDAAPRTVRNPSFSAKKFVRAFGSGRENVRRKLLGDVARFHRDDPAVPAALREAVDQARRKGQLTPGVFWAVRLLGECGDPSAQEALADLLADPDPRVAMTAIEGLVARGDPRALDALAALVEHPRFEQSYPLRHALVCAAGQLRDARSVTLLIDLLPRTGGQLKYEAARQLSRLTGQNFGGRSDEWAAWWSRSRRGSGAAARPAASPSAAQEPMPWDGPLPAFFSIPVPAYRTVFVIDSSKSMLSSVDGETRLERVKDELSKTIRQLPPETSFEVIAFNDLLFPWKGKLVPATDENKRSALKFVRELHPRRKTAGYDALEAALNTDEFIESIVFLSDGRPTAGRIVDPAAILQAVRDANQFRRIAIHAVAIDAQEEEHDFMRQLAEQNFGEFHLAR